jgi:hypothetical protein
MSRNNMRIKLSFPFLLLCHLPLVPIQINTDPAQLNFALHKNCQNSFWRLLLPGSFREITNINIKNTFLFLPLRHFLPPRFCIGGAANAALM